MFSAKKLKIPPPPLPFFLAPPLVSWEGLHHRRQERGPVLSFPNCYPTLPHPPSFRDETLEILSIVGCKMAAGARAGARAGVGCDTAGTCHPPPRGIFPIPWRII